MNNCGGNSAVAEFLLFIETTINKRAIISKYSHLKDIIAEFVHN